MNSKQFINDREGAEIANFKIQTLRNWRHQNIGPPYVKIGRAVRYDRAEFIEYLEKNKIRPGEQK